jgi:hypothetical protein
MTIDSNSYKDFFPYSLPRKGQSEMMDAIEEAVRAGVNICSEAPNGFGKTCVTLSGVLPWVKENNGKILYCARTHRQLDRVVEELVEISKRQDVSGVSFRGRRHMCLNPFVIENSDFVAPISEVCGQLKATGRCSYYENLKKAGWIGAGMLLMFIFGEKIHLVPAVTALIGATGLMVWIRPNIEEMIDAVDWTTLVFFMSLFIKKHNRFHDHAVFQHLNPMQ